MVRYMQNALKASPLSSVQVIAQLEVSTQYTAEPVADSSQNTILIRSNIYRRLKVVIQKFYGYDAGLFRVKVELVLQLQNLQNSAELLQNDPQGLF